MIGGSRISGLLVNSVWAIGGGAGTRAITQLFLGSKNAGVAGYAANAGVALALGMLGAKAFGRQAGEMLTLGGFVGLVMRVISEQTSIGLQLGRTTRGLGDLPFAGLSGARGLRGGFERMDYFNPLASSDPSGRTAASMPPAMLTDAISAARPVAPAGVSGLNMGRSRYGGGRVWG